MIDFLIKSTISLAIFHGFYHLVLQKEKMHQFNRLYLLATIVISLALPFISFEIIKIVPITEAIVPIAEMPVPFAPAQETIDYTPLALWMIYGLITTVLLVRSGKNIHKLISKSKSSPTVNYKGAILVLTDEKVLPHTFLNRIFINIEDYNNHSIEDELYTHELVHVNQKHTLDILFIEFLKTVFWFNPIFIVYKKAIQLNHEFLADEKVVQSYNDVPFYQKLLLQKGSGNPTIYLASNLNYLVTKKRLIMMNKSTSKTIAAIKKAAVVPIIGGLIYFFCIEVVAQEKPMLSAANEPTTNKDKIRDSYYSGVRIILKDTRKNITIDKLYEELTLQEKRTYLDWVPDMIIEKEVPEPLFKKLSTKDNAVWINHKLSSKEEISRHKRSDFIYYTYSFVHKNARSKRFPQEYQYTLYTKEYFDKNMKTRHLHYSNDTLKMVVSNYVEPKTKQFVKAAGVKIDTLLWYDPNKEGEAKQYNLYVKNENSKIADTAVPAGNQEKKEIYSTAELTDQPEYEGGITEFYKYIAANFKIPEEVNKNKLKGKVFMSFIIESDGSLSNIKILKDMGHGTGEEAARVLKDSPKWKPGKMNGKPIRTSYSLPIMVVPE